MKFIEGAKLIYVYLANECRLPIGCNGFAVVAKIAEALEIADELGDVKGMAAWIMGADAHELNRVLGFSIMLPF